MVTETLIVLATSLFGSTAAPRAQTLVDQVVAVADADEPLFACKAGDCAEARQKTASLLTVWAFYESAGKVDAVGDNGSSYGLMQMKEGHFYSTVLKDYGGSRQKVLKDGVLSLRLGLAWMRYLRGVCGGSVERALNAYASGTCAGTNTSRAKVKARCKLAGGC